MVILIPAGYCRFTFGLNSYTQKIVAKANVVPFRRHAEVAGILLQAFVIAGGQRVKILTIQVSVLQLRKDFLRTQAILAMSSKYRKQVQTKQAEDKRQRNAKFSVKGSCIASGLPPPDAPVTVPNRNSIRCCHSAGNRTTPLRLSALHIDQSRATKANVAAICNAFCSLALHPDRDGRLRFLNSIQTLTIITLPRMIQKRASFTASRNSPLSQKNW